MVKKEEMLLKCKSCGITKPASEFYKNNKNLTGYKEYCKDCIKKSKRK